MPGVSRLTIDQAVQETGELFALGVRSVLLFGIPDHKDAIASSNYDPSGIVQRAIRAIKSAVPEMIVIADLCASAAGSAYSAAPVGHTAAQEPQPAQM